MHRTAWLQARRSGLGGSDVGQLPEIVAACNGDPATDCAPWASPWKVWASKAFEPEDTRPTAAMSTGNILEDAVIAWGVADVCGTRARLDPSAVPDGVLRHGPLVGTPDAFVRLPSGAVEGVEAKVSGGWAQWDRPPFYYELQCRVYMALTRVERFHLCVFHRHLPAWQRLTIERDRDVERALIDAAAAWWQRHVVEGAPPAIDETDDCRSGLAALHPRGSGASVADFRVATPDEINIARDVLVFERRARDASADLEEARNRLRGVIGPDAGIRWTGGSARWAGNNRIIIKE